MKILHYSLGFPPYRTGGLTKYCIDLMEEQIKLGNEVSMLWPGEIRILNKNVKIKKNKPYNGIVSYEIINPLPVPLLEGINMPIEYMKKCNKSIYEKFLEKLEPDIIHIHTFMGIHREFLEVAKQKNIKIVYTSHDYFGLCPKVNLFNYENSICDGMNNEKCTKCCKNALGKKKIYLLQNKFYRSLKDCYFLRAIRQKAKHKRNIKTQSNTSLDINETIEYTELQQYYKSMFKLIDQFYFNSEVAYEIFNKHFDISNYKIVPITHKNVIDKRTKKTYQNGTKLEIGYIGPETYAKGYNTLKEILDKLQKEGLKFELNIYFKSDNISQYVISHKPYNYANMDEMFKNMDVIIVPSNWKETFGFGILEAIAFGVPVICSKNVGASYLVKENDIGYVYEKNDELEKIIREICISKEKLRNWNNNIVDTNEICMDMLEHTKTIIELYKKSITVFG